MLIRYHDIDMGLLFSYIAKGYKRMHGAHLNFGSMGGNNKNRFFFAIKDTNIVILPCFWLIMFIMIIYCRLHAIFKMLILNIGGLHGTPLLPETFKAYHIPVKVK